MACERLPGGLQGCAAAARVEGPRFIQPGRFRNGPGENLAAEKLPMP